MRAIASRSDALKRTPRRSLSLSRWVRIVTWQYSMEPLSAAGSLHAYGGRFNAGADLDAGTLDPWPSLYIAEDAETAFREKFQIASNQAVGGLKPEELALAHATSYATLALNIELHAVFDMTSRSSLQAVAKVFSRIKMPRRPEVCRRGCAFLRERSG